MMNEHYIKYIGATVGTNRTTTPLTTEKFKYDLLYAAVITSATI